MFFIDIYIIKLNDTIIEQEEGTPRILRIQNQSS